MSSISIVEEYFLLTKENKKKHEKNTVVFLVGAFYEVYAIKMSEKNFHGSDIEKISEICDLSISSKQSNYKIFLFICAGFHDYTLEKYVLK